MAATAGGAPPSLPANNVLTSAQWVMSGASHVTINTQVVADAAAKIAASMASTQQQGPYWDAELHFHDGGPLTAQYLLVVDTLNFCFWPDGDFEYEHLAGGLKASLLADPTCLDAHKLAAITGERVQQLLRWPRPLPQQEERARLLREVGTVLQQQYGGQAAALVQAAAQSALRLVQLLAAHCPGFRDHAVYKGQQVFFYKRAQIFAADLWGAFGGRGMGAFGDIGALTMFADYRVPVTLRHLGVLSYSRHLADAVDGGVQIAAGSEEEVEIRAASIVAVELLKQAANALLLLGDAAPQQARAPLVSIELDVWLWEAGERMRSQMPHHKTLTVYY